MPPLKYTKLTILVTRVTNLIGCSVREPEFRSVQFSSPAANTPLDCSFIVHAVVRLAHRLNRRDPMTSSWPSVDASRLLPLAAHHLGGGRPDWRDPAQYQQVPGRPAAAHVCEQLAQGAR